MHDNQCYEMILQQYYIDLLFVYAYFHEMFYTGSLLKSIPSFNILYDLYMPFVFYFTPFIYKNNIGTA